MSVCPFQYNPVTGEMIAYSNFEIEVETTGGTKSYGDERYRSPWFDPIVDEMVMNYESLPKIDYSARVDANAKEEGCEYLIVIPNNDAWRPYAEQIKEYRLEQGINTKIMSLSEMGCTATAQMKTFFHNAYNNWDVLLVAVLLMADHGTDLTCNIPAEAISHPYSSTCITDNQYADPSGDLLPDMVFARMTASTTAELAILVSKVLEYEYTNPCMEASYYNNPITALGWQTARWFQICAEVVGGYLRTEGKSPVRINEVYEGTPGSSWSSATNTSTVVNYFGPDFLPDYGPYANNSGNWMPAFGNVAGKYFLAQSSWPSSNSTTLNITYQMFTAHSDAFLRLYTEVPQTLAVTHPSQVTTNTTDIVATATAGSVIALSTGGNLLLAVAPATGNAQTLTVPTQTAGTEIVIVATKQNYLRYRSIIEVAADNTPNVVANSVTPSSLMFGETTPVTLTMINNGTVATTSATTVTVSCSDPDITVTDATEIYPAMSANGGTATVTNGYTFALADNIQNSKTVTANVTATNGNNTWTSTFLLEIQGVDCDTPVLTATPSETAITLSWTGSANTYLLYKDNTPIASGLTSTTYTDSGLTTGQEYCYQVQGNCDLGTSEMSAEVCATTQVPEYYVPSTGSTTITACGGTVYDHAGPNATYSNSVDGYLVVYPTSNDALVQVAGSYTTESRYDYLYIYDGAGTSGTQLGKYSGSGTIADLQSTTGPLTIRFTSDYSVTKEGFELTLSCYTACTAPTITITASDDAICSGENVTLTAAGATYYSWNTGATSASITVSPTSNTTYTVTGYDVADCEGTASQSITVNQATTATERPLSARDQAMTSTVRP